MAYDPNSALGQTDNLNSKLADYFKQLNEYLAGGSTPPDFATFVSTFDLSELHRMTKIRSSDIPSYENGAAIENAHHMSAVIREFDMRMKTKGDYYQAAEQDYSQESQYYSTMGVFWTSMISGTYIDGDTA